MWQESFANPLDPDNPLSLCKPPIFSDRFTLQAAVSDVFMRTCGANFLA
jgi:hypothetical protein